MKIPKKNKIRQLFCKHDYVDGKLDDRETNPLGFQNIQGTTITTICQKCGKIKGTRFHQGLYM